MSQRNAASLAALACALALYLFSLFVGSDLIPPLRNAVGNAGLAIFPSLTVGGSAVLVSVLCFGASLGLFMSVAADGARYVVRKVPRLAGPPTLQQPAVSGERAPQQVKQKSLPTALPVPRFALGGTMDRVVESMAGEVSSQMISAGVMGDPMAYVGKYVLYGVAGEILSIPISLFLVVLFRQPLILLINAVPLAILAVPRLSISSKVGDSIRGVEEELPHFAVFAAIAQSAGLSLYSAFERIVGSRLFKWMEYEGLLIKRETTFFGTTPSGAIDQRASEHRSARFRSYLQGYSSVLNSGGDIAKYLQDRAKEFLYWTEFRWKGYAQSSSNIGEGMVALFFTLPLLVLTAAIVSPAATLQILAAMIIIGVPMLSAVAYTMISRLQPKTYSEVSGNLKVSLPVGVAAGLVAYYFSQQIWLGLAAALIGFSALEGYAALPQLKEINKTEDALPSFVRDITEYRKVGYDLTKAIQKLARERAYNKQFDEFLKDVSAHLDMGMALKDIYVKSRSWLAKMVFFMLGQVAETGGGTPELLESVNDFTQRMVNVKRETRANMRIYEVLAYATPVGLAITVALLYFITQQFGTSSVLGGSSNPLSGLSHLPPAFIDLTRVLVVEVAASLAFLASRTIDFTDHATVRVALCVAVAVVAIAASQDVVHLFGLSSL